jgi:hypothetical protein
MTREYYQRNRERILFQRQVYAREHASSPVWRRLQYIRKRICNTRDSIAYHQTKVKQAKDRLAKLRDVKEILELKFGQERARKKALSKALGVCPTNPEIQANAAGLNT